MPLCELLVDGRHYSFTELRDNLGRSVIMPYIPLMLTLGNRSLEVTALLDTGASVNVLPYEISDRTNKLHRESQLIPKELPVSAHIQQI